MGALISSLPASTDSPPLLLFLEILRLLSPTGLTSLSVPPEVIELMAEAVFLEKSRMVTKTTSCTDEILPFLEVLSPHSVVELKGMMGIIQRAAPIRAYLEGEGEDEDQEEKGLRRWEGTKKEWVKCELTRIQNSVGLLGCVNEPSVMNGLVFLWACAVVGADSLLMWSEGEREDGKNEEEESEDDVVELYCLASELILSVLSCPLPSTRATGYKALAALIGEGSELDLGGLRRIAGARGLDLWKISPTTQREIITRGLLLDQGFGREIIYRLLAFGACDAADEVQQEAWDMLRVIGFHVLEGGQVRLCGAFAPHLQLLAQDGSAEIGGEKAEVWGSQAKKELAVALLQVNIVRAIFHILFYEGFGLLFTCTSFSRLEKVLNLLIPDN